MIHHYHHHHKVHHIAPAPKVPSFLPTEPSAEPAAPATVVLRVTEEGPEIEWLEDPLTPEEIKALEEAEEENG